MRPVKSALSRAHTACTKRPGRTCDLVIDRPVGSERDATDEVERRHPVNESTNGPHGQPHANAPPMRAPARDPPRARNVHSLAGAELADDRLSCGIVHSVPNQLLEHVLVNPEVQVGLLVLGQQLVDLSDAPCWVTASTDDKQTGRAIITEAHSRQPCTASNRHGGRLKHAPLVQTATCDGWVKPGGDAPEMAEHVDYGRGPRTPHLAATVARTRPGPARAQHASAAPTPASAVHQTCCHAVRP